MVGIGVNLKGLMGRNICQAFFLLKKLADGLKTIGGYMRKTTGHYIVSKPNKRSTMLRIAIPGDCGINEGDSVKVDLIEAGKITITKD